MYNFKPGGVRHRKEFLGGRPKSDADYGTKKRFDNKPRHDNRDNREVKLFAATCTTCGKSCEVPFRPDGTKPVLCRDCFANKNSSPKNENSSTRDRFSNDTRQERRPERQFENNRTSITNTDNKQSHEKLVQQISTLDTKLNQLLDYVKSVETKISNLTTTMVITPEVTPKIKATKAEKPVVKKKAVVMKAEKKVIEKKVTKKEPKATPKKAAKKVVEKVVKKAKK